MKTFLLNGCFEMLELWVLLSDETDQTAKPVVLNFGVEDGALDAMIMEVIGDKVAHKPANEWEYVFRSIPAIVGSVYDILGLNGNKESDLLKAELQIRTQKVYTALYC